MKSICETLTLNGIPALTVSPDGARRCPVVFLQHGFGGRKEDLLDLAWRLASRGCFAVAFDAVHHGEQADVTLEASTYDQWRQQMDAARPATERHAAFMRSIDPSPRLAAFYPRPLFMLCGDLDTHQPKSYTLRLYRALLPVYADHPDQIKLKIYDGVGHELSPGMMEDVADWFAAHLLSK